MDLSSLPLLSIIVFLPFIGALVIALMPVTKERAIKTVGLAFCSASLIVSIVMASLYNYKIGGMQFVERVSWVKSVGLQYLLAVDGLSLPFIILACLLGVIAFIISLNIKKRVKEYFIFLSLLTGSMIGVFLALDYILFYLFWETVLIPLYFLIGIWGGERREYASIKFFLFTLFGSVFMLLAILGLYFYSGAQTFDMIRLAQVGVPQNVEKIIFIGLFVGFAVKVPIFPFHTWLADAHVEAPTAVSVLLAGILLKMGGYGILRVILPTVPDAFKWAIPVIIALGIINIVYGALLALAQTDLKKLVAYSSISHMGLVVLGIATFTSISLKGAVYQMISHGLISALMFGMVGAVYERFHTRKIPELTGVLSRLPVLASILVFGGLAAMGMPAMSGFIGEYMVILGVTNSKYINPALIVFVLIGLGLTAGYILSALKTIVLDKPKFAPRGMKDISIAEAIAFTPLVAAILALGVYPPIVLYALDSAIKVLLGG